MATIGNIVICYQNEEEVIEYAKQLSYQINSKAIKLYIVFNKHGELPLFKFEEYLRKLPIEYYIIDVKKNLGYLNGLIEGAKVAIKDKNFKWLIFSNTDIKIKDKEFFVKMQNLDFYNNSDIWLVGPSVFATNQNTYSNPYKVKRPTKYDYIRTNIFLTFPRTFDFLYNIKKRLTKSNNNEGQSGYVYAIHGSFMILRKELIEMLMERKAWELLYDEEPYLSEIVRTNKKKVYYENSLLVEHYEGASTGKTNLKWKFSIMKQSNKRMLREFY